MTYDYAFLRNAIGQPAIRKLGRTPQESLSDVSKLSAVVGIANETAFESASALDVRLHLRRNNKADSVFSHFLALLTRRRQDCLIRNHRQHVIEQLVSARVIQVSRVPIIIFSELIRST